MDKIEESLSALIDGEASEIEIHKMLRLLKTIDSKQEKGDAVAGKFHHRWASYQEIRSIINTGGEPVRLTASQHLELRLNISNAIDAEETHQLAGMTSLAGASSTQASFGQSDARSRLAKYRAPVAGLAIAASLVVAIFVGLSPAGDDAQNTGQGTFASAEITTPASNPISAQTVSTRSGPVSATSQAGNASLADAQTAKQQPSELNSLEQRLLSSGEEGMLVDQSELKELNEEQKQQMRAYLHLHDRMTRSNPNRRTVNFNGTKN